MRLPAKGGDSLIFHYNLKMFDSEDTTINGLSLKRFVMQSVTDGVSFFSKIHITSSFLVLNHILSIKCSNSTHKPYHIPGSDVPSPRAIYPPPSPGYFRQ